MSLKRVNHEDTKTQRGNHFAESGKLGQLSMFPSCLRGQKMKLADAYKLAEKIKGVLAPMCEKIEIAGSIRRARKHVNDVDIVLLPKSGSDAARELRAILRKCAVIKDGEQNVVVRSKCGQQIDVRFAHGEIRDLLTVTPSNWGAQLLCWTGSKEHNIYLNQCASKMGLMLRAGHALVANAGTPEEKTIASATEEEIFKALGLDWIPPVQREIVSRSGFGVPSLNNPKPETRNPEQSPDWSAAFATQDP